MKIYRVVKINIETEEEFDYGTMCEEDMKLMVRGYHHNTEFGGYYEKKNSRYIYIVSQANEI
jgi:hypothetical protein